jgi:exosortase A
MYSLPSASRQGIESSRRSWGRALVALAVSLVLLGVMYHPEIDAAVNVWINSTAFNHCFLILPIMAYLVWEKREAFETTSPQPAFWVAGAALPLVLLWLVAQRIGIMEARQLIAMSLVQVLFLAVLGPTAWRPFAFPLVYLYFLVPVGEFLVPHLQAFTAAFIAKGLTLLGILNYSNGVIIEIPEGSFLVAEACAGLRFLVASAAFGALYGYLMYQSFLRRTLFFSLSLIVPIVANGFRALGIVVLAHVSGNAEAAVADHLIYGWVFFSFVTLVLTLAGLPFRQPRHYGQTRWTSTELSSRLRAVPVVAAIILLAVAASRLSADYADNWLANRSLAVTAQFPEVASCDPPEPVSATADIGGPEAAKPLLSTTYVCGKDLFTLQVRPFSPHAAASAIFAEQLRATSDAGEGVRSTRRLDVGTGRGVQVWRITERAAPHGFAADASAVWIGSQPALDGVSSRVRQAWSGITGTNVSPIIVIVRLEGIGDFAHLREAIDEFLRAAGSKRLGELGRIGEKRAGSAP